MADTGTSRVPPDVEQAIKAAIAQPRRGEAALILASIANRATAALHQLARAEAQTRKGTAEWGRWASLVNASRDAVLRTATCRQTASQLAMNEAATPLAATEAATDDGGE